MQQISSLQLQEDIGVIFAHALGRDVAAARQVHRGEAGGSCQLRDGGIRGGAAGKAQRLQRTEPDEDEGRSGKYWSGNKVQHPRMTEFAVMHWG